MSDPNIPDQEPVSQYVAERAATLEREKEAQRRNTFSAVLFRAGENLLALSTTSFREVVDPRKVHNVPHRSNEKFLGIVNVRGILHLCVNLQKVLTPLNESQTPADASEPGEAQRQFQQIRNYPRLVVIQNAGKTWAFSVDEIISLQRFAPDQIVKLADEEKAFRGMLEWEGRIFHVLDEERLFLKLEQCL